MSAYLLRFRPLSQRLAVPALALAGALETGRLAASSPQRAADLAAVSCVFLVGLIVPARALVVSLLIYLPLQDLAITYAPGRAALAARFAPDVLVLAAALASATKRPGMAFERCHKIVVAVAAFSVLWIAVGAVDGVKTSTLIAGARSEFRFLPLLVATACSLSPRRDARIYIRVLAGVAAVEAVIGIAEAIGGVGVRKFFAPDYTLSLGSTLVGHGQPPLSTVFGTFSHRTIFGTFLALAATLIAAAGSRNLGISRRSTVALWLLLASAAVPTGSRQSVVALLLGTTVVLSIRHGLPAKRVVAGALAIAVLAALASPPQRAKSDVSSSSLWRRWSSIASSAGWKPAPDGNFRLYYGIETAKVVARDAPVTGFGLGTASDPRVVASPSGPLQKYDAGQRALATGFYTDSNWTAFLLETGYAGLAFLILLLIALYRIGARHPSTFWGAPGFAGITLSVAFLGLAAPAFQLRPTSFILWCFAGVVLADRYEQKDTAVRPVPAEAPDESS